MDMTVTADHLMLLKRFDMDWDGECEFGAVSSDCKRPYGNSDVDNDVSEIIGRDVEIDEARKLTIELSAILNFLIGQAEGMALLGVEIKLPRRAARELES